MMRRALCIGMVMALFVSMLLVDVPSTSVEADSPETVLWGTPHAPIRIDSDADFPGIATTGDGSAGNPWIIENWDINGTGYGYCIFIGNTTEYFEVRDCYLHDASGYLGTYYGHSGLHLYQVHNGTITNNTASSNRYYGIYLESSSGNTIANNNASSNINQGIYLMSSNGNVLVNNTASSNNDHGIRLDSSNGNTIANNTASNNLAGIYLISSNGTAVTNNTITSNNLYGINLYTSCNNTFNNNTLIDDGLYIYGNLLGHWNTHNIDVSNTVNAKPLYYWKNQTGGTVPMGAGQVILANCSGVRVENQELNNGTVGIELGFSSGNTIVNNTASSNDCRGISLESSSGNTITNNTALYNYGTLFYTSCGIFLHSSNDNTITKNNASSNDKGVYIQTSTDNTVANNTLSSNNEDGILLESSSANTVANNTASSNNRGIFLSSSNGNTIVYNNASNDGSGIRLYSSSDNTIANNTISNNDNGIRVWGSSSGNIIANNTVSNNNNSILLYSLSGNTIYHNNFTNNINQAYDDNSNVWDNGYPSGGNYWDDYAGSDIYYGVNQDIIGIDGIGDTNYSISGGANVDNYPLMEPYTGQTLGPSVAAQPFALNYTPNGTAVPVNAIIEITWNETMNWTSVEEAFDYTDGVAVWNSTNGTWVFDSGTNVSTFTPDANFDYETQYFVAVNCTATDIIGNKLDQNKSGIGGEWPDDVLIWNFTTTDAVPRVVSTIPAHNQVEVAPDTVMKVFFSERMNTTSVEQAFSYTNGSVIWTVTNGSVAWNVDEDEITFTPTEPLEKNMTYTARIDAGIAKDPGGKTLDWNYSWSFTTWVEPPLPHVIHTTPPDGSSGIGINTHINVEFDVAMDVSSVESVFSYTNGIGTWYGFDGTFQWSADNTRFSFQPDEMLDYNTTYNVTVGASSTSTYGMSLDGNANGIVDVDDSYSFNFTTAWAPPFVLSTFPANEETEVAEDLPAIAIDFNKRMNTASVNAATSVHPAVANYSFVWNNDDRDLTILLGDDLKTGTFYQVTVLASATDLFGIKLDGNNDGVGGDNFVFTFITRGVNVTEAPYIVSVFPPPGNITVPINTFIGVSFSKAMNHTSVEAAFSLKNSTATINGTFTWSSAMTVKFFPERELAKNTTYFVTIGQGTIDTGGIQIEEPFSWQFITVGEGDDGVLGGNWWLIAIIVFLVIVVCIQYLKIRGTQVQLRRARVKIKKLKKGSGIEEKPSSQETVDESYKESAEQPSGEPDNITEDIVNGEITSETKPES